jgi:hypothetical protein
VGIFIGIAITGRQYYLAALPAMIFVCSAQWLLQRPSTRASAILVASLGMTVFPIFVLAWIWGGITSPGIQTNVSYANFSATFGLNLARRITAFLFIGIYVLPILLLQSKKPIYHSTVLSGAIPANDNSIACSAGYPLVYTKHAKPLWVLSPLCIPLLICSRGGLGLRYNSVASLVGPCGWLLRIRVVSEPYHDKTNITSNSIQDIFFNYFHTGATGCRRQYFFLQALYSSNLTIY